MAAFYSSHLAAVSERLCLGPVSAMQDAMRLRQANVTHALIVCSHAQLRHAPSREELSVAEVLTWLLADAQLAQAVRSCAAAGVQAKLVLVNQPNKVVWSGDCPSCFVPEWAPHCTLTCSMCCDCAASCLVHKYSARLACWFREQVDLNWIWNWKSQLAVLSQAVLHDIQFAVETSMQDLIALKEQLLSTHEISDRVSRETKW